MMKTIEIIRVFNRVAMTNNDGATFKRGKSVTYKTGYQVATEGIETTNKYVAIKAVLDYNGNAGIWYSDGVWYVDNSLRMSTKRGAIAEGRACNQQSILRWSDMSLIWLK